MPSKTIIGFGPQFILIVHSSQLYSQEYSKHKEGRLEGTKCRGMNVHVQYPLSNDFMNVEAMANISSHEFSPCVFGMLPWGGLTPRGVPMMHVMFLLCCVYVHSFIRNFHVLVGRTVSYPSDHHNTRLEAFKLGGLEPRVWPFPNTSNQIIEST